MQQILQPYSAESEYWSEPLVAPAPGNLMDKDLVNLLLSQEQRDSLITDGFVKIPSKLSAQMISHIRSIVNKITEREGDKAGSDHHYSEKDVQRLGNLVFKHETFRDLALDPVVLAAAQFVMDTGVKLYMMNARSPLTSDARQPWHTDGNHIMNYDVKKPDGFTAIWYLADSTVENGATIVIPGSHLVPFGPKWGITEALPGEISVEAKAGDLLLMNANVWHQGGLNSSNTVAPRILCHYKSDAVLYSKKDGMLALEPPSFDLGEAATRLIHFREN